MAPETLLLVWLVSAVLGAVIGASKGRGGLGFALGALLGVVGLVIIAVVAKTPEKRAAEISATRALLAPTQPSPTPPGWWADPWQRHQFRYWDGVSWTQHVSDNGIMSIG